MSAFISFLQLLRTDFTDDEQIIIACPSQEQISVLMTSLLMTSQPRSQRPSVSSSPPRVQAASVLATQENNKIDNLEIQTTVEVTEVIQSN